MAHFFGWLQGQAGGATRLGSKRSGIAATVETWGCEARANINHCKPHIDDDVRPFVDENGEMDILSVRFGEKNSARIPVLTLRNPDAVARVTDDPKIRAMFDKMHELSKKIEAEAPKAQRRIERERKRRQREFEAKQREQAELREGMSDAERRNFRMLCSPYGTYDEFYERQYELRRENGHLLTDKAQGGFRPAIVVNLTTGDQVPVPMVD